MESMIFIIRSAFEDLLRDKLRSFLTTLGIFIGIFSVVVLSAFGIGLRKYIEDQFAGIGSNLLMVMPGKGLSGSFRPGGSVTQGAIFEIQDADDIGKIKGVASVAPIVVKYAKIESGFESKVYEVLGSTADIFEIINLEAEWGSLFTKSDSQKGAKIAVLGAGPASKLFKDPYQAFGGEIKIDKQVYKITGITKAKGGGQAGVPSMDDHVFIPYKSAPGYLPAKKFYALYLKFDQGSDPVLLKTGIEEVLLKRLSKDDFSVSDQKEVMGVLSQIFNAVNIVVIGISAISLIVGGVGVMNIMFVAVSEKTKEIGIRRAIGATKNDILRLFLVQAVFLTLSGGFLAIAFAFLIVSLIKPYFPAYIEFWAVILALSVSSGIGLIFGVVPARKASELSPIDAIKYE